MKTYKFCCRSTRRGFTEWASVMENDVEVRRIDRDVHMETVRQFRERVGAELEAQGYQPAEHQYTL
ncbi:MAG: hypothetical protein IJ072_03960 [Oscillospiraceae bacterium]|nr:hypothetical protein [Oscillospiraceae bacterium]